MEITLSVAISILAAVISVLGFAFGRKDKSNKDTEETAYKQGQLDTQLKNILEKLEKIERKLDTYDTEIETQIEKALEVHLREYHRSAKK